MKKIVSIILILGLAASVAFAQSSRPPKRYMNFGYVTQEINFEQNSPYYLFGGKAEWGASAEFGTTYFLHKRPIAGFIRVGLDFSYLDLQYAQTSFDIASSEKLDFHFTELGMQLGPSITCSPMRKMHIKLYGRYAPTYTAYASTDFDNVLGGYAGFITTGLTLSYSTFTLGVEMRSTTVDLKEIVNESELVPSLDDEKHKTKLPSTRFTVGFRF